MVTQRPLDYKVFFWSDHKADEEEGVEEGGSKQVW